MTDKEKYIEFLKSIGFKEHTENKDIYSILDDHYLLLDDEIYLGSGRGYSGFFSWLEFDKDGKYVTHGAAE